MALTYKKQDELEKMLERFASLPKIEINETPQENTQQKGHQPNA